MKKIMAWSCMLAFVVSSAPAFAQWNALGKGFKGKFTPSQINAAQLQRALGKVGTPAHVKPAIAPTTIPAHLNLGNKVFAQVPALPKVGDNVSASYLYKMHSLSLRANAEGEYPSTQDLQVWLANEWVHGPSQNAGKGKMFYDNQAELARDLNEFYGGSGVTVTSPSGRMLKVYMLPVDNILYKPYGFAEPVVLSAEKDFVIYDVGASNGQLVENTPQMRQFFSRPANSGAFEEVISLGGRTFYMPEGEPDWDLLKGVKKYPEGTSSGLEGDLEELDFEELPVDPSFSDVSRPATAQELKELTELNKQQQHSFAQPIILDLLFGGAGRLGTPEEIYEIRKMEIQQNLARDNQAAKLAWKEGHYSHIFDSQDKLGEQLHRFHRGHAAQVEDVLSKQVSYVYEIPVAGLYFRSADGQLRSLDPVTEVVLFNEHTGGKIVRRDVIESQKEYKFVQ